MKKLLIVDVAALGWDLVAKNPLAAGPLAFRPAETIFPALTCPVQASFRTALPREGGQRGRTARTCNRRAARRRWLFGQSGQPERNRGDVGDEQQREAHRAVERP